jgi:hypothetical protein
MRGMRRGLICFENEPKTTKKTGMVQDVRGA